MPVLAVTGSFGSGKSTVVKMLKAKGAVVYDIDKMIHQYYRDRAGRVYRKVASLFPQSVSRRGCISRPKLAELVFSDPCALSRLEAVVHPVIIEDLKQWVNKVKKKKKMYAAEVPLLFEKKLQNLFDGVILVCADKATLFSRLEKARGISRKEANKRMPLFLSDSEKKKQADFIIDNRLDLRYLRKKVDELWYKVIKAEV